MLFPIINENMDIEDLPDQYSEFFNGLVHLRGTIFKPEFKRTNFLAILTTEDGNIPTKDDVIILLNTNYHHNKTESVILEKESDSSYHLQLKLDNIPQKIKQIFLFVIPKVNESLCDIDNIVVSLKQKDNITIGYNFWNNCSLSKLTNMSLNLGLFYRYENGWRFFPKMNHYDIVKIYNEMKI